MRKLFPGNEKKRLDEMENAVVADAVEQNKVEAPSAQTEVVRINLQSIVEQIYHQYADSATSQRIKDAEEIIDFLLRKIAEASRALSMPLSRDDVIRYIVDAISLLMSDDRIFMYAEGSQKGLKSDLASETSKVERFVNRTLDRLESAMEYSLKTAEQLEQEARVGCWDRFVGCFRDFRRNRVASASQKEINKIELEALKIRQKLEMQELKLIHARNKKHQKLAKMAPKPKAAPVLPSKVQA